MTGVRPFVEGDIPQVADLLWKYLHVRDGSASPGLGAYLRELFFQNPWADEGIVTRVYENRDGRIVAFFGAVPRRMRFQGRSIRLAFGSNLVVDPNARTSMAAIQLVKAFMKGTQDVSITDSATDGSRQLLRSLGFSVVPVYSLYWARPLRPFLYGLHAVSSLQKSRVTATMASISRPFCAVGDALAGRIVLNPFRQARPTTTEDELGVPTLIKCLETIPGKHLLLPEYDQASLTWVLDFISSRKAFGDIRKVLVRDEGGDILGWYIYSAIAGGVGNVLQLGSKSSSMDRVLAHLFHDAASHGLIGLEGRLEPQFMEELSRRACPFFRSRSWTLVHSKQSELVDLFQSGAALFSRLEGEWCLRPGVEIS
jgi:hypothetical protein